MARLNRPTDDPGAAAAEQERRRRRESNVALQRNIAAAKATELHNVREAVRAKLADLKRHTVDRDRTANARQRYDRTHGELYDVAVRLDKITGEGVAIPVWLPPPDETAEEMVIVKAPTAAPAPVVKRKDPGKKLTSMPVYGSALDAQLRAAGVVK